MIYRKNFTRDGGERCILFRTQDRVWTESISNPKVEILPVVSTPSPVAEVSPEVVPEPKEEPEVVEALPAALPVIKIERPPERAHEGRRGRR